MDRSSRRSVILVIAAGTLLRLAWGASTPGVGFDIASYQIASSALLHHGLRFYGFVNAGPAIRWPYPPAYLPWTLLAHFLTPLVGFRFVVALPAIAADAALTWLVAQGLARRGAADKACLAGAALVAFGPLFALTSGYHGQIDAVAILPPVVAVQRWSHSDGSRAVMAGMLLGVAALIKTPAGLVVLALLPTIRDRREALVLISSMLAVAATMLAPFALSAPYATFNALRFAGTPGEGGLSLVLQPSLAQLYVGSPLNVHASQLTLFAVHHAMLLVVPPLVAVTILTVRSKARPEAAASALFLTLFVFGDGFAPRYAIWLLPMLLLAGRLRGALLLQLGLLGPVLAVYAAAGRSEPFLRAYETVGVGIWIAFTIWWLGTCRQLVTSRPRRRIEARVATAPATDPLVTVAR